MNKKTKNLAKIVGIWFCVFFIFSFLSNFSHEISCQLPFNFLHYLFNSLIVQMLLLGLFSYLLRDTLLAILILYFVFKNFKSHKTRIISTAFFVPFILYLSCFLGHHICSSFLADSFSYFILISFLFITIVATLFTPKTLLTIKKEICVTCILMGIFSVLFFWIGNSFLEKINNPETISKLTQYERLITEIEDYKNKNGVYPNKINDNVKIFKNFVYKPTDNNTSFSICILDKNGTLYIYSSYDKSWKDMGKVQKEKKGNL